MVPLPISQDHSTLPPIPHLCFSMRIHPCSNTVQLALLGGEQTPYQISRAQHLHIHIGVQSCMLPLRSSHTPHTHFPMLVVMHFLGWDPTSPHSNRACHTNIWRMLQHVVKSVTLAHPLLESVSTCYPCGPATHLTCSHSCWCLILSFWM